MFHFKKSLGQNFLRNDSIIEKAVRIANVDGCEILEMGPGKGALTKFLVNKAQKVVLVEKDERLIEELQNKFHDVEIFNEDFLKWDISKYITRAKFVSNIPYNITGPIIEKLLSNRDIITEAHMIIQKEVAQRIVAKPGDKNRSLFSVIVQMFANPKIGFYVSRNSFYPVPDVDSAFISLYFNNKKRDDKIVNMVKLMFANKRKQVINNLSCLASKKDLENIFRSLKLNPKLRAEDLSINDIEMLGEILKDKIK
ncbi:MAG TPA: ribosomal RNA small subunit methyltransferase A [Fusobacteria bacterium]|nr:ribosomal RNA small subunit methyltransferase A [Fusobacteriota bacterium]